MQQQDTDDATLSESLRSGKFRRSSNFNKSQHSGSSPVRHDQKQIPLVCNL